MENSIINLANKIKSVFSLPVNGKDNIVTSKGIGFDSKPLLMTTAMVENQIDLDILKGSNESFQRVFDTWTRISRQAGKVGDAALPTELTSWTFNDATNSVSCTINSSSVIGFISPDRYDDYILEVVLKSTSGDDDFIGLAIAFAEDRDGKTHMLSAMRGGNGKAPLSIDINYDGFDRSEINLERVTSGLHWFNGSLGMPGKNGGNRGWNSIPEGIRMKITRKGDIITVETTQSNSDVYFAPAKRTIDLNSRPELAVFKGPQRYGYIAVSQPYSTWVSLERPGGKGPVYDIPKSQLWTYSNGEWVVNTKTIASMVSEGLMMNDWLHHNRTTNTFFYVKDNKVKRL